VELFQQVPGKLFAGVADGTNGCQVTGIWHWTTDENPSTQETFQIVLRKPDMTGALDPTSAGVIMTAGPFNTPLGGTVRTAWRVQGTFATPVTIPCQGGFFMGVSLMAAPTWPTDGLSVWEALYYPPSTRNFGDNPRQQAPPHAWVNAGGNVLPPMATVLRIGLLTTAPVLNIGGIDPGNVKQTPAGSTCYGAGGMYPDISGSSRADGIDVRFENLAASNTATAMLLISSGINVPISSIGVEGNMWLDLRLLLIWGYATMNAGTATIVVAPPRLISPSFVGLTVFFQGATIDFARARTAFTNAQGVSL
jgi:hypothetical protein